MVLIGFMGVGKTSVGKALCAKLGWRFVDLDLLLEAQLGESTAEFFQRCGEAAFRKRERELISRLRPARCTLWSAGGGAVLDQANVAALRSLGPLILLTASVETIYGRLSSDLPRPLFRGELTPAAVDCLLRPRLPFYEAAADLIIATDGLSIGEVADLLKSRLGELQD